MNDEKDKTIKDMGNLDEPEFDGLDKPLADVKDLDLDQKSKPPTAKEIRARIEKAFPGEDIIKVDNSYGLIKMATGNYKFDDYSLDDLTVDDLNKLDTFLRKKEGAI